jgi:hypothetical protein
MVEVGHLRKMSYYNDCVIGVKEKGSRRIKFATTPEFHNATRPLSGRCYEIILPTNRIEPRLQFVYDNIQEDSDSTEMD